MPKRLKAPWLSSYGERKKSLKYPNISMYDQVEAAAKKNLDILAYDYFGNRVNFSSLLSKIDACARGFKALDIKEGDVISICSANIPEAVIAIYAANKIGAVANIFHPLSAPNEIKYYMNLAHSETLVMIDVSWPTVKEILDDTKIRDVIVISPSDSLPFLTKVGFKIASLLPTPHKKAPTPDFNDDRLLTWAELLARGVRVTRRDINTHARSKDIAAIIYSGGTTGSPKGVALSNLAFTSMSIQLRNFFSEFVKPGNGILGIMPIFHGFGLAVGFHMMWSNGLWNFMLPKFDVKKFDKILAKARPTFLVGVPTLYEAMLKNRKIRKLDLSFVKVAISGGDNLPDPLKQEIDNLLRRAGSEARLIQGYGLAECLSVSCVTPVEKYKPGTIGIPLADVFYKIVEPLTDVEKPVGELGEIVLTGPNLMDGYVENERETNEVLRRHGDGHVWLHTGDVGYMDEEGYIFFKQRIKRIIVSSGYNIYPSHVEEIICKVPEVLMATVVGMPDKYRGQIAKAFVVLRSGLKHVSHGDIREKIMNQCQQDLAKYEWPREIEFRDSLPKTKIGKVAYTELTK